MSSVKSFYAGNHAREMSALKKAFTTCLSAFISDSMSLSTPLILYPFNPPEVKGNSDSCPQGIRQS